MNRIVHIEYYNQIEGLILYTIRFEEKEINETDAFFERFMDDPEYEEDVKIIYAALRNMGKRGAMSRYLRPENDFSAVPVDSSILRLYCIKGHKYCLILGGGGIKSSQKVQDSPDAYPHFKTIQAIEKAFRQSLAEKEISWEGDYLAGNLTLEIDL